MKLKVNVQLASWATEGQIIKYRGTDWFLLEDNTVTLYETSIWVSS